MCRDVTTSRMSDRAAGSSWRHVEDERDVLRRESLDIGRDESRAASDAKTAQSFPRRGVDVECSQSRESLVVIDRGPSEPSRSAQDLSPEDGPRPLWMCRLRTSRSMGRNDGVREVGRGWTIAVHYEQPKSVEARRMDITDRGGLGDRVARRHGHSMGTWT